MKCLDCNQSRLVALYEDPRDPPLHEGPCLCLDCFTGAAEDEIYNRQLEIEDLKQKLAEAKRS
jgi:hypothetical protein